MPYAGGTSKAGKDTLPRFKVRVMVSVRVKVTVKIMVEVSEGVKIKIAHGPANI